MSSDPMVETSDDSPTDHSTIGLRLAFLRPKSIFDFWFDQLLSPTLQKCDTFDQTCKNLVQQKCDRFEQKCGLNRTNPKAGLTLR